MGNRKDERNKTTFESGPFSEPWHEHFVYSLKTINTSYHSTNWIKPQKRVFGVFSFVVGVGGESCDWRENGLLEYLHRVVRKVIYMMICLKNKARICIIIRENTESFLYYSYIYRLCAGSCQLSVAFWTNNKYLLFF